MKFLSSLLLFLMCGIAVKAQLSSGTSSVPDGPLRNPLVRSENWLGNRAQEMNFDRGNIYLNDQIYTINGMQVLGSPFLYRDWSQGSISTTDGRTVTAFKLRYNAYDQTVSFFNGKDSLDIVDPIKEFTLFVPDSSGIDVFKFVNANEYKKEKTTFYYEVLIDSTVGQLLRTNRKVISEGHDGLPVFEGKKTFNLEVEYYFYNKETKKLYRIKGNGINIPKMLNLTAEEEHQLNINAVDFNREVDLLNFFSSFFELRKPVIQAPKTF